MKKSSLLILLLFISQVSFGSDSTSVSRFSVGINFSPDYCYRTITATEDVMTQNILEWRNELEIEKFGYSFGVNASYKISHCTSIELGLQYSDKGYQYDPSALTFGDKIDPRYGFVYQVVNIDNIKQTTSYYYLDVPLRVLFSIGKKKLRFISSAGIITNFLLSAETKSSYHFDNGENFINVSSITSKTNKINISPTLSLGAEYSLSNKFFLRVEPTFRYGIISVPKDDSIDEYLWSAGLNVSGYYRF